MVNRLHVPAHQPIKQRGSVSRVIAGGFEHRDDAVFIGSRERAKLIARVFAGVCDHADKPAAGIVFATEVKAEMRHSVRVGSLG